MKKILALTLLPLVASSLTSCFDPSSSESSRTLSSGETVSRRLIKGITSVGGDATNVETLEILFKKNGDVPYVALKDGFRLIKTIKDSKLGKKTPDYTFDISGDSLKVSNGSAYVTFDAAKKKIVFDDFNAFTEFVAAPDKNAVLLPTLDFFSFRKNEYIKGPEYTLDLSAYSSLDIYHVDNDFFLPLKTWNDVFINSGEYFNFVYNFTDFYMVSDKTLAIPDEEGKPVLTSFGKAFYNGAKKETVSSAYARYFYDSLLFDLNSFYGMKQERAITDFDTYFTIKGYKEDFLSGDVHRMDNALAYALSTLLDGHSAMTTTSPLYGFTESTIDVRKVDPAKVAMEERDSTLKKKRAAKGIRLGKQYYADASTVYVTFDSFSQIDKKALYRKSYSEDAQMKDNNLLLASLYTDLQKQENKGIKNVVVDIACNDGGSADSMAYALNLLVGEAKVDTYFNTTKARGSQTFLFDLNLDGKVDANDKSLRELGYRIAILSTKQTYSSGNALTCLAKTNSNSTLLLGERSGGGASVMRPDFTAIGSSYSLSGLKALGSTDASGKFTSFEAGMGPDIALNEDELFDRPAINAKLATRYGA